MSPLEIFTSLDFCTKAAKTYKVAFFNFTGYCGGLVFAFESSSQIWKSSNTFFAKPPVFNWCVIRPRINLAAIG